MKLSLSFSLSILAYAVRSALGATTELGHVFIYDPCSTSTTHSRNTPTLDPHTARLIFAQRLGLSAYHSLGDADENALDHINAFGVAPEPLFGDGQASCRQALFIVEGVESPEESLSDLHSLPSFHISDPPSQSADGRLLADLATQDTWTGVEDGAILIWSGISRVKMAHNVPNAFVERGSIKDFVSVFNHFKDLKIATTIVFSPSAAKRNHKRTWGQYETNQFHKRQSEELLEPEPVQSTKASSFKPTSAINAFASSSTTQVAGILPTCFASLSSCQSQTFNCSGHGICNQKYNTGSSSCWACNCNIPSVQTNPDGTKLTTNYGGAACQKKDISVPFWLLTGFTIGMVAAIAAGISMLFSVGQEELPSVIGAGVSGPKPK